MVTGYIILLFVLACSRLVATKLIKEELTLTWDLASPNGQYRELIKINGQFPGPTFVWDEDDNIEVLALPFFSTPLLLPPLPKISKMMRQADGRCVCSDHSTQSHAV